MESATDLSSIESRVRDLAVHVQRATNLPGISIGLSVGGERIYVSAGVRKAGSHEPLTEHTRWHLGCATKLLSAIAVLELARRRLLDLDAPLERYVPELEGTRHGATIRIMHLLSHTSGYRGTNPAEPQFQSLGWNGFMAYLRCAPQHFAPGTVFNHEHSEAVIAGEIVRRVTGTAHGASIRHPVFEALGLSTGTRGGPLVGHHAFEPRGRRFRPIPDPPLSRFWRGAFSTDTLPLTHLLNWTEAAMPNAAPARAAAKSHTAAPGHTAALPEPIRQRLAHRVVDVPPTAGTPLRELLPIGFGCGLAILRGGLYGNTGASHGQCIGQRFDPAANLAVVVGLNACLPQLRDSILAGVCYTVTGRTPPPDDPPPLGFDLRELAGVYEGSGKSRVAVRLGKHGLVCDIGRNASQDALRVQVRLNADGRPIVEGPSPLSLGFFAEPRHGEIALMLGLNAYRRTASSMQ